MRIAKIVLCALMLVVAGCAPSGPQYKEAAAAFPTLAADKGRVVFYRSDYAGAVFTPEIQLNGRVVGKAERGGFFYADERPGKYTVSTSKEGDKKLSFNLAAKETKYIRSNVSLIGRTTLELVTSADAKKELADLNYTGTKTKK